jgi:hypothetical protein
MRKYRGQPLRLLIHNGREQTVAVWAAEIGMGVNTLRSRLTLGWGDERALTIPINDGKHMITFRGKTASLTRWAKAAGLHVDTLHRRISRGWELEDALTLPLGSTPSYRVRQLKKLKK